MEHLHRLMLARPRRQRQQHRRPMRLRLLCRLHDPIGFGTCRVMVTFHPPPFNHPENSVSSKVECRPRPAKPTGSNNKKTKNHHNRVLVVILRHSRHHLQRPRLPSPPRIQHHKFRCNLPTNPTRRRRLPTRMHLEDQNSNPTPKKRLCTEDDCIIQRVLPKA